MIRFICNQFQLDLTSSKISFIEDNFWFKDTLFSEYSLPSSIYLNNELRQELNFFFDHNIKDIQTTFDGHLMRDGVVRKAVFSIDSISKSEIKFNIKIESNKISTWESKLAALNLQSFELENETILTHAESIIGLQYPDVNYNFPMIYLTRYDTSDATFAYFKKYLNFYENGHFVENEIDEVNNIIYNRNIMQPFPYLLYVLKQGFADSGLTLSGDILTDPDIQKALIVAVVDYFNTSTQQEIPAKILYGDYYDIYNFEYDGHEYIMAKYYEEYDITEVGQYRIIGDINMYGAYMAHEKVVVKYGDEILYQGDWPDFSHPDPYVPIHIDVTFDVTTIDISAGKKVSIYIDDRLDNRNPVRADLSINPIRYHNVSGDASNVIYLSNEINLKRTVPDMEFGELVKAVMNWKNFDFELSGDEIIMNYISNSMDRSKAYNLSDFTPKDPKISFNKDISFELHFDEETDVIDFTPKRIYIDRNGAVTDGYTKQPDTKEVVVKLLPLPKIQDGNIVTSYLVGEDTNKLYLAFYEGLQNGLPVAVQRETAVFPELYNVYLKDWYELRINTRTYQWQFYIDAWRIDEIKINRLIYAYNNFFIIKKIDKTRVTINKYEVKITADKI